MLIPEHILALTSDLFLFPLLHRTLLVDAIRDPQVRHRGSWDLDLTHSSFRLPGNNPSHN